jgi:hypothetical protein
MLHLLGAKSVRRGGIFDVFLAATMLDNGVRRIYTENVKDFNGVSGTPRSIPFNLDLKGIEEIGLTIPPNVRFFAVHWLTTKNA